MSPCGASIPHAISSISTLAPVALSVYRSGNRASAHWTAQMGPHSVAPGGATGTFQLDAAVVGANYYNP